MTLNMNTYKSTRRLRPDSHRHRRWIPPNTYTARHNYKSTLLNIYSDRFLQCRKKVLVMCLDTNISGQYISSGSKWVNRCSEIRCARLEELWSVSPGIVNRQQNRSHFFSIATATVLPYSVLYSSVMDFETWPLKSNVIDIIQVIGLVFKCRPLRMRPILCLETHRNKCKLMHSQIKKKEMMPRHI